MVTNTRFQHPRRHLVTWRSNDGRTSSQIDYILVQARWASSVLTLEPIRVQIRTVSMDQIIHLSAEASVYDCRQEYPPKSRNESTSPIWSKARVRISVWNFTIGSLSASQDQTLKKLNGRPSNLLPSKRHIAILASSVVDIGTGSPGKAFSKRKRRG